MKKRVLCKDVHSEQGIGVSLALLTDEAHFGNVCLKRSRADRDLPLTSQVAFWQREWYRG